MTEAPVHDRNLLEAILRIVRHGRMIHTKHHAELVEIAHATVLRLRALEAEKEKEPATGAGCSRRN